MCDLGRDLDGRFVCFQIEIELIFNLNPNLAPSEPPSVIPSKLSRVSVAADVWIAGRAGRAELCGIEGSVLSPPVLSWVEGGSSRRGRARGERLSHSNWDDY